MDASTIAIISLWVSGILAAIRIFELVDSRRPKLSVVTSLTSDPEIGNTITILNASNVPANIWYFELAYVEPGRCQRYIPLLRKTVSEESPLDHESCNITVPPHGQHSLDFSDGDHFNWGPSIKCDIYLKIWMVGRRSQTWFWITGPSGR